NIYRIDREFLLCYTEFAFYVNKNGWRARPDVTIYWEGFPTAFALRYPYVMAFDSTFVEIRHVKDGAPVQIIHGKDIRCLFAENQPSAINSSRTHLPFFRPSRTGFTDQDGQATTGHTPHVTIPGILPDQLWRDKIIFLSDNQVMEIERAEPLPRVAEAQ
ncbi:RHO1 GDP-GTP exchange protein 2, partial [Ceratobasidium sp. 394]